MEEGNREAMEATMIVRRQKKLEVLQEVGPVPYGVRVPAP